MMRRNPFVLSMLASLVMACGSASQNTTEDPSVLAGKIGPEGGVIEGKASTPFAGVRLEIPRGALSKEVTVRVRPALDPQQLPLLAESVGQQFAIEAEGATLAMPAHLTLPVDSQQVEAFSKTNEDVKVWVKDGDAFKLTAPTSTAPGSVTIDLARFTIAGAGIKVIPSGLSCLELKTCDVPLELLDLNGCSNALQPCITNFGALSPLPESTLAFATDGMSVHYLARPTLAQLAGVRLDLVTKTQKQTPPLSTTSQTRANPTVLFTSANAGYLAVGLGNGALGMFTTGEFGAQAYTLGIPSSPNFSIGAARTSDNDYMWNDGTKTTFSMKNANGQVQDPNWQAYTKPTTKLAGGLQHRFVACTRIFDGEVECRHVTGDASLTILPPTKYDYAPGFHGELTAMAVSSTGIIAMRLSPTKTHASASIVVLDPTSLQLEVRDVPNALDVAWDTKGRLWATIANEARVVLFGNPFLAPVDVPMSAFDPSTTTYQSRIGRGIRPLSDGSVVVMTAAGHLLRLQK